MDEFEKYVYIFHDVMDEGLTFNAESVKVKIGDIVIDKSNYEVVTNANDLNFDIKITDNLEQSRVRNSVLTCKLRGINDQIVTSFQCIATALELRSRIRRGGSRPE